MIIGRLLLTVLKGGALSGIASSHGSLWLP